MFGVEIKHILLIEHLTTHDTPNKLLPQSLTEKHEIATYFKKINHHTYDLTQPNNTATTLSDTLGLYRRAAVTPLSTPSSPLWPHRRGHIGPSWRGALAPVSTPSSPQLPSRLKDTVLYRILPSLYFQLCPQTKLSKSKYMIPT